MLINTPKKKKLDKPSFTKEYRKYDKENGTKGIKL